MIQQSSSWPARTFDALVMDVTSQLRSHGFSVLSDIDVQAKLREDLGVDSGPCRILGACHAHSAGEAGQCNVIVRLTADQGVEVNVMDPAAARDGTTPAPQSTAAQVHRTLERVLQQGAHPGHRHRH